MKTILNIMSFICYNCLKRVSDKMIDVDKFLLSKVNKDILSDYLRYLITVKFLKKETTVNFR